MSLNVQYTDWGKFIQMKKSDWKKLVRYLRTTELKVQETVEKINIIGGAKE
jgi:hypothetical protein